MKKCFSISCFCIVIVFYFYYYLIANSNLKWISFENNFQNESSFFKMFGERTIFNKRNHSSTFIFSKNSTKIQNISFRKFNGQSPDSKCRRIFTTENIDRLIGRFDRTKESVNRKLKIIKNSIHRYIEREKERNRKLKSKKVRSFFTKTSGSPWGYEPLSEEFFMDFYRKISTSVPSAVNDDFSTINKSRLEQVFNKEIK